MDSSHCDVNIFHGGMFVGPPLRYQNFKVEKVNPDVDRINVFMVRNFISKNLGYSGVSDRQIYYKGVKDGLDSLKILDGDDCVREIISLVEADKSFEIYVDHLDELGAILAVEDEVLPRFTDDEDIVAVLAAEEEFVEVVDEDVNGTQGADDMGDLTQEVNLTNLGGSSRNEGLPNRAPKTSRKNARAPAQSTSRRARYAETIRRYKSLDLEEVEMPDLDAPPTRRGRPVNLHEEMHSEGESEEGVDYDLAAGEEHDGPNVLRPIYDDEYEDDGRADWVDDWYNPDAAEPLFKPGMKFESYVDFKHACRKYAIVTRTDIRHLYNEPKKQIFRCFKCPWRIHASPDNRTGGIFRVKTLCDFHRCRKTIYPKLLSSRDLANHFRKKLHVDPFYKVKTMIEDTWKEMKFKVKWDKCSSARDIILKELEGNFREEYGLVEAYAAYLNSVNPGNNIRVVTGRDSPRGALNFRRMYFCLGVIKEGWKKGCRPILGVDGCFLKSVCQGVLLMTAIGRDGNGGFYPVAWAVVESESYVAWKWFFELLRDDLEMGSGENFTIISDQAPVIIKGTGNVLPKVEHRLCVRHIYCNLAKRYGLHDDDLRMRFWNAAKATYNEKWQKEMVELFGVSTGAYNEMMQMDKTKWCKAFFMCHSKCDSPDNNITESFNAWIPHARARSIISMNEEIMNKLLVWLRDHKRSMQFWETDISPMARGKVNFNMDLATDCNVIEADDGEFKVYDFHHKATHCVKWGPGTCTCRVWQLTGIPCAHVLATAAKQDVEPETFVHDYYRKEKWLLAYGKNIEITRGSEMWSNWGGERPEPPIVKRKAGRPRVNRMKPKCGEVRRFKVNNVKGAFVLKMSRVGRISHCNICKQAGHNIRTCKNKGVGIGTSTSQQPPAQSKTKKNQADSSVASSSKQAKKPTKPRKRAPAADFAPPVAKKTKQATHGQGKGKVHE